MYNHDNVRSTICFRTICYSVIPVIEASTWTAVIRPLPRHPKVSRKTDKSVHLMIIRDSFAYFFIKKKLCCGCSLESLMSTHNIGLYEETMVKLSLAADQRLWFYLHR